MMLNRRHLLMLGAGAAMVPALPTGANTSGKVHEVAIRGLQFDPQQLSAAVGDHIRFTNHDLTPHTATADDGSWDTGALEQGESTELTVAADWTGGYFCVYHPSMTARLDITA